MMPLQAALAGAPRWDMFGFRCVRQDGVAHVCAACADECTCAHACAPVLVRPCVCACTCSSRQESTGAATFLCMCCVDVGPSPRRSLAAAAGASPGAAWCETAGASTGAAWCETAGASPGAAWCATAPTVFLPFERRRSPHAASHTPAPARLHHRATTQHKCTHALQSKRKQHVGREGIHANHAKVCAWLHSCV
eukprot:353314-Chlamydomonas_euryale.AAC.3